MSEAASEAVAAATRRAKGWPRATRCTRVATSSERPDDRRSARAASSSSGPSSITDTDPATPIGPNQESEGKSRPMTTSRALLDNAGRNSLLSQVSETRNASYPSTPSTTRPVMVARRATGSASSLCPIARRNSPRKPRAVDPEDGCAAFARTRHERPEQRGFTDAGDAVDERDERTALLK